VLFKRMYSIKKRKNAGFSMAHFRVHTVYFHGFTLSLSVCTLLKSVNTLSFQYIRFIFTDLRFR
jgi:hypothetical protein